MQSNEIRERFLSYFEDKGHERVASASLIPANDPTLLFSNAGMNQFKDTFLGHEKRDYTTAASSQKCVRAGGKHNDLDNVGYTARHHTFFEMLGNFSFGDYFKSEAIDHAWRFLTEELKIPKDRLYVTVFEKDDEAFAIWRDEQNIPEDRIFRFGEKDNFWSMGDTGPCGPCSEIFFDYGDSVEGPADPYEAIASGSDKIVEVWNLVFMQFNRDESGEMTPLPNPSIDTGMGLERICAAMQGVTTNYDTDLFLDVINPVAEAMGKKYGDDERVDVALRVIADHLRAMSFLVADGVNPSNEGRGYVLRRIMRRAMRYGKQLGMDKPFLFEMTAHVIAKMGEQYPELVKEQKNIELYVKAEEEQFAKTLDKGLPILLKYLDQFRDKGAKQVPGDVLHFMYGTHGFPVDLMEDMARDWNLTLDMDGFRAILDEEGQDQGKTFVKETVADVLVEDAQKYQTEMTCYAGLEGTGKIMRIMVDDAAVAQLTKGAVAKLVMDSTPFYAESGGQIGDEGTIRTESGCFKVSKTTKVLDKLVLHEGVMEEGTLSEGQEAEMAVASEPRAATMKNHTATHILHQALRDILGPHVRQAGSLVDPEKLRFDFNHFSPVSVEEMKEIEDTVNAQILANTTVGVANLSIEDAKQTGAIAFFGEKYGDEVRVVSVGDYSKEFCGGTHVGATGEIGSFKIISEKGLAAGVRRLVALTGPEAIKRFQESERLLRETQERFFYNRETLIEQLTRAQDEKKALERRVEELKMQLAKGGGASERIEEVKDFKVILKQVSEVTGGQLRQLADELMDKVGEGVVLLASEADGKAQLVVKSSRKDIHSGKLVGQMAAIVGGRGGGRPDMAMAGGKDTSKLGDALEEGLKLLQA